MIGFGLTPRQLQLYNYIRSQITTTGQAPTQAPTLRSMAAELGISIPGGVCKLCALQAHGLIRRGVRRGIELVDAGHGERLAAWPER